MESTESLFHKEMAGLYYKIKGEAGFISNDFRQAVQSKGGVKAAKEWLAEPSPEETFFKLWKLKRLDLSMENVVLRKQYASLFTAEELATAKKRLSEMGYTPTES